MFTSIPTLNDIKLNIREVKESAESLKISPINLLAANHTLWRWTRMREIFNKINKKEDFPLIEDFWILLKEEGVQLTEEEKKEVFIEFIND